MKRQGFFRRILAKIRREKKEEKKKAKPKAHAKAQHPLVKHGKKFKIDEKKLRHLEKKVSALAKKHNVPEKEIQEHVKKIEAKKVILKAHELPNLEELEKRVLLASGLPAEAPKGLKTIGAPAASKAEEVKAIAVELKKHRIITDFDRVLSAVQGEGKTSVRVLNLELGIEKKTIDECCAILEESGLIEMRYPAIGSPMIEAAGFEAKRKEELSKKKEEKKAAKKKAKGGR
ncbi:MAG: hypothetical protein V1494_01045 [Candidatus Diapherotrites archaeon]